MGRTRTYTVEQTIGFIDEYIMHRNNYSIIQYSDIVKYCNENLKLNPRVTYQTFSRCREAKEHIRELNSKLDSLACNSISPDDCPIIKDSGFDIEKCIKKYKGTDGMREVLSEANRKITELSNRLMDFSKQAEKCSNEITSLRKQNESLVNERDELITKASEAKKLKKELNEQRRKNSHIIKYITHYIYDPMVQFHMQELQLLPEDADIKMVKGSENLIGSDDIHDSIREFYDLPKDKDISYTEDDEHPGNEMPVNEKPENKSDVTIVMTKESADLMDKIQNL